MNTSPLLQMNEKHSTNSSKQLINFSSTNRIYKKKDKLNAPNFKHELFGEYPTIWMYHNVKLLHLTGSPGNSKTPIGARTFPDQVINKSLNNIVINPTFLNAKKNLWMNFFKFCTLLPLTRNSRSTLKFPLNRNSRNTLQIDVNIQNHLTTE